CLSFSFLSVIALVFPLGSLFYKTHLPYRHRPCEGADRFLFDTFGFPVVFVVPVVYFPKSTRYIVRYGLPFASIPSPMLQSSPTYGEVIALPVWKNLRKMHSPFLRKTRCALRIVRLPVDAFPLLGLSAVMNLLIDRILANIYNQSTVKSDSFHTFHELIVAIVHSFASKVDVFHPIASVEHRLFLLAHQLSVVH